MRLWQCVGSVPLLLLAVGACKSDKDEANRRNTFAGAAGGDGASASAGTPASDGGQANGGTAGDDASNGGEANVNQGGGTAGSGSTSCDEGTLSCPCYGNGTCDSDLICRDDVCSVCTDGALGCDCYGNGTCDGGLECVEGACVNAGGEGGSSGEGAGGNSGSETAGGSSGSEATGGTSGSEATGGSAGGEATGGSSGSDATGGTSGSEATGGSAGSEATGGSAGSEATGGSAGSEATGGTSGSVTTGGTSAETGGTDGETGGASAETGGTGTDTGGSTACTDGTDGCACYGNGTCNTGLLCQSDVCVAPVSCEQATMIDDMEDGDGGICDTANRAGGWFAVKAGTGTTTPTAGTEFDAWELGGDSRDGSVYGMRLRGSGFTAGDYDEFAMLGVSLHDNGIYDASVHTGIRFYAKASTSITLRVNLSTTNTRESPEGDCVPQLDAPCYDSFGEYVDLGTTWQLFSIHFGFVEQDGWGKPATFDIDELWNIEFIYKLAGSDESQGFANPTSFDFFIDDVEFW